MDYKTLYEKLKKDNEKYIREEQKKIKIWFSQQAGKGQKMKALEKENEELKKENEKMKAFINELKVNVVKKD